MSFQPKNVILSNLLSNCDVARKKPKFDFLGKIMHIEANYIFMNQTIVISFFIWIYGQGFHDLKIFGSTSKCQMSESLELTP